MCFCAVFFFFFKQKTAYEMRISDWSSDVCSSDLVHARTRSRRCAATAVLRRGHGAMTDFQEVAMPYRPLVVFDFDHTLYDGDSGSHLVMWLIRRHWWRDRKSTRLNSSH